MDNPANPVFFNTFDPFDTPTPPAPNVPKPSSLTNSSQATNPDVTTNVLTPSASANTSYGYLSSPLDSPSINPYPLPKSDSRSSFTSPSPTPLSAPPAYSGPSSVSNSYSNPALRASPIHSPSLTSTHPNGYPQTPSPVPQSQPAQFQSPPYLPPSSQSSFQSSSAPSQPSFFDPRETGKYFQPPSQQIPQPQAQVQTPTPQPPSQPTPPPQQTSPQPPPQSSSSFSSPLLGPQPRELFEQMNKNINAVMARLDSIENRLSFLEITTKEVLNNQRTISTQQRKLQDSVDTTAKMPLPMPQHTYEEPRKPQVPVYPQAAPMPITPPGPVIMPPPTHSHMPALVPVTHIPNRGEMEYKSSSRPSQYDADLELAKKLQAEFDASSSSSTSSSVSASLNSNSNSNSISNSHSHSASSYSSSSRPSQTSGSQSKSGQQECPICQTRVTLADLEAHVEQHFEDEEAKRAPLKPGEKPTNKAEAKAGFFAKLFGPKPEDEKRPVSTETTPSTSPTPSQVPYTHTMNPAAYNQQRMAPYYAASPSRPTMAYPSYYGYPPNMPQQRPAQPQQQYLYYPNLDQGPQ